MPSQKRALAEANVNVQRPPKRTSNGKEPAKEPSFGSENATATQNVQPAAEDEHEEDTYTVKTKIGAERPYEYVCIEQPFFDFEAERKKPKDGSETQETKPKFWTLAELQERRLARDKEAEERGGHPANDNVDDEEEDEEETIRRAYCERMKSAEQRVFNKPSAEHPEWKWVTMRKTWEMLCEWQRREMFCCPDLFDMYLFNDYHGYGTIELVEDLLVAFNQEYTKTAAKMSIDNMWAIMATLGHWLQDTGTLMRWQSVDDGERVHKLMALIGCGFLTMLDCVDRFGSLGRDSEFKDLGLVMSLYLRFSDGLEDYSIDEESMAWRKYVIGYAKKARIDLVTGGCHEVRKILEDEENQDIAPLKDGSSRGGRWKWPKNYKEYKSNYETQQSWRGPPKIGGDMFDITKMTRQERAEAAFDKKDPLAHISDADLRKGKFQLG